MAANASGMTSSSSQSHNVFRLNPVQRGTSVTGRRPTLRRRGTQQPTRTLYSPSRQESASHTDADEASTEGQNPPDLRPLPLLPNPGASLRFGAYSTLEPLQISVLSSPVCDRSRSAAASPRAAAAPPAWVYLVYLGMGAEPSS
jgi:hypothetical protein